jgi:hypothetical protein
MPTVTIRSTRLSIRNLVALPVLALGLIALMSACASHNSAAETPMPTAQPPALSSPEPSASSQAPSAMPAPSGQEHLIGMGSETVLTIHGKVVSVDRKKQLVTLELPGGKKFTIKVYNPYNLAAAKPGAPFVAKYYEIATIRKLLPGESLPAASLSAGILSATPGQTPGAVVGKQMQLVVTIDAINKDNKTIAVKGPDGVVETVSVANAGSLKLVKVGEKIVVTVSNVVAIALEPEPAQ